MATYNGSNATVSTGSTGAITTGGTFPSAEHSYAHANSDLAPEMKVYYDKTLLEEAEPNLVHAQFGQKRPIPAGSGKTIEFRKFSSLPKATTPLNEGVTPAGQSLNVTNKLATVEQYGGYVQNTDVLELAAIDPIIYETTKLIGSQAGRTLDTLARDALLAGTFVQYCPTVSGTTETPVLYRKDLDGTSRLTVKQIKKAAAILRGNNTPTINGDYVAIIHPYVAFDLMSDPAWEDIQNYATPENRLAGEIGRIGGVRFVQTTEAKIYAPGAIADGIGVLTVYENASSAATSVKVTGELTAASGVSIPCYINGVANTITAITPATGSGYSTLTVSALSGAVTAGAVVCGKGAAKGGECVYATLVLGQNAYGTTEIAGGGLQTIVKQRGSAGTADPLDQRSTIGWKALFTAEILCDEYMLRIESVSDEISASEN